MDGDFRYCPRCAGALSTRVIEGRERLVCAACGFIFYRNPIPAAAVVLMNEQGVLLVRRKFEPRAGDWSLPAGFMEWGESPEETAVREAKEETNLDIAIRGTFGVYRGSDYPGHEIVLVVYHGEILRGRLRAGDDALEARFFQLSALPPNLAFGIHRHVLATLRRQSGSPAAQS